MLPLAASKNFKLIARVAEGPDDAGNIGQGERVLRKHVKHVRS